jgi:ribonuclease HI
MADLIMYCDGLTEPTNPGGYACWAWCLLDGTVTVNQAYGCLGHGAGMTNNVAEYEAVIRALTFLQDQALDGVRVRTDAQLVVRQLQGVYAVRSPTIMPLYQRALLLVRAIQPVLEWVPREQNTRADALTREAYRVARGAGERAETGDLEVLQRLDAMAREVTPWEASFLDSVLQQLRDGRFLSPKQHAVLEKMAAQYLSAEATEHGN